MQGLIAFDNSHSMVPKQCCAHLPQAQLESELSMGIIGGEGALAGFGDFVQPL